MYHVCDCVGVCADGSGRFGVPFFFRGPLCEDHNSLESGGVFVGLLSPKILKSHGRERQHARETVTGLTAAGVWPGAHVRYPGSSFQQPCHRALVTLIL